MKPGDLVRHKQYKTNRFSGWKKIHLVIEVRPKAFKVLDSTGFYPPSDYEVISESR
jgi:hypothetical protein